MALRLFKFLLVFALGLVATGCAPAHFSMHDTMQRVEGIRTIGVIPPDINVYQISADGGARLDRESEAASRSSVEAMMAFFKETGYKVKVIGPDLKTRKELKEVQALSKAVHKSLQEFWDPAQNMPAPALGSLENLAEHYRVEAFMFMDGLEVHKEEKASLSKSLAKLAVNTVYGPSALPKQGRSRACISLAEASGAVIWASFRDTEISLDENFKDREAAQKLVRGLLSRFPR